MTPLRELPAARLAIAIWAIVGVLALLGQAIARLLPRALEPVLDGSLTPAAIVAFLASIVALGYSEGYRGFQQRFSPRAAVRAVHLARNPKPLLVALAPMMAMGLIHGTRRRLIGSWTLLAGIIVLIVLVSRLEQPWRGAIDAGVVVGLGWGWTATLVLFVQTLRGRGPDVPAEVPGEPTPAPATENVA